MPRSIMARAKSADEGAKSAECIALFGVPDDPREHEHTAQELANRINLCYLSQLWPGRIEGHWANLRHAVRDGIHPDALDRAEEAILPHAKDGGIRQLIQLLRIRLREARA